MRFHHGHFLGNYQNRRELNEVSVAELTPTVPEHEVEQHTHENAHFLLLLSGNYVSSAQGMPRVCSETVLIMNPPGTEHRDCFRGEDGHFLTLSMPANAWIDSCKGLAVPNEAMRLDSSATLSAYRIWCELRKWDDASTLAIEAETQSLFSEAIQTKKQNDYSCPRWLNRARELLRDRCFETPRLSELARIAGVHPVYFSRAFRRRYGCAPGEYLRRCRMERAIGLLKNDRQSLIEIALQCGFVDQSHFYRSFSQAFRINPGDFRRLSQQGMVQCIQDRGELKP
jgi:AraC family transcriptional regulator